MVPVLPRILGVASVAAALVVVAPAAARVAESAAPSRAAASVTLASVSLDASWKESWLTASLTFSGTTDAPVLLTAFVRPVDRPGGVVAKTDLGVAAAGAFTGQLRLPPRILPGTYRLRITGGGDTGSITPVESDFAVPAPPEGVVDKSGVSTARGGRFVDRLQGTTAVIWARFHFAFPPATKTIEISWYTPSFKFIGKVKKPYKPTVETFLRNTTGHLQPGVWYAIAKVNGVVVKRTRLRIV